jgi:two-component system copper resistance phosphate regulon response regulator CusR
MRILIIEDEQKMARLLKKGLEEEDHIVMLAYNGVDGLELSRTYPFDVIVLDVKSGCPSIWRHASRSPVKDSPPL